MIFWLCLYCEILDSFDISVFVNPIDTEKDSSESVGK